MPEHPAAKRGARVLYLSYDGMTDPLGGSQVLPYLRGLAERGHRITLLSCEKAERFAADQSSVAEFCRQHGIDWHPLPYRKRPPVLSTVVDLVAMRWLAERLHRNEAFGIVHCRSYLPALIGLALKRRHGVRYLFDMRGFWADERVDGGLWNLRNPLFRTIFRWFKAREVELLAEADAIVSLTEAARDVLLARPDRAASHAPISVIPCCTDFAAFPPPTDSAREAAREVLEIPAEATVAGYLGSIGTWYLLGEMLDFFAVQRSRDPEARFLLVTRDDPAPIRHAAVMRGIPEDALIIRPATRAEVPKLLAAADYGLFFIKPCFSKIASSPVKLGEMLALELPVVTNAGVGDVDRIVQESGAGLLVQKFDDASYAAALDGLAALNPDMRQWRTVTKRWFDLEAGIDAFDAIYRQLSPDSPHSVSRDTR